jgi:hypothetical protein
MGTSDGSVIGTTQIVNHGPATQRWNLVILGDGYQAAQLSQFHNDAQSFVNTLFATPPFGQMQSAINVFRIDVSSTDSGADDPAACGGPGTTARTYFDAAFCNGGIRRLLEVNNSTVMTVVNAQVPQWHMLIVIVNSTVYGGSGGQVACFSLASGANEIGLHEMGHTAFGFADEYEYYQGCGIDTDRNQHPNSEPTQPNVTVNTNRDTIKWRDLIAAATAIPTTRNASCAVCDPQPNPVAATTVGAFEGAHYYHCGAFRPQFNCRMRALGQPFCAVCQRVIQTTLEPFLPQQSGWRWCHKCQGFFFGDNPTQGVCPDRSHDASQSGHYAEIDGDGGAGQQGNWRWCHKCQGMFFHGNASHGVCPADGQPHDASQSGHYATIFGDGGAGQQGNWRWCHKCQGMFFHGNASHGICPADGQPHDASQSGHYASIFSDGGAGLQGGWRWCHRCQGMFFSGNPSQGACPDHSHDGSQSGLYAARFGEDASGQQGNWRWCHKCQGMFFNGNASHGTCPADGLPHDGSQSGHYAAIFGDGGAGQQGNWRWCHKCQGMFFNGNPSHGVCPTDGQPHDGSQSGHYAAIFTNQP